MPVIIDPKMNHKERKYGLIEVNGTICLYEKENKSNNKRFMPFGFEIEEGDITLSTLDNNGPVIYYMGNRVTIKANFEFPDGDPINYLLNKQGPVVREMFKWAKWEHEHIPKKGLKELIENGLGTEL